MTELFDDFYKRYEQPEIEELTVGYTGIDPPLNPNSYGIDHECLDGLLGGDDYGHYHLTEEQLKALQNLYNEDFLPKISPNQSFDAIPNDTITPYEIKGRNIKLTS